MTPGTHGDWTTAPLIALDLEGSGAQDHEDEAILEIAVVPIAAGQPDTAGAYSTLINPGRAIPRRPWISPGLTTLILAAAPGPADIEPELARHLKLGKQNSLTALTTQLQLTAEVDRLAAGSQPHRALWDAMATALLLPALIARCWPSGVALDTLLETAGISLAVDPPQPGGAPVQETLFDPVNPVS